MSEGDVEAPPTHHDNDEDGENTAGWNEGSLVSGSLIPRLISLFHEREPGYKAGLCSVCVQCSTQFLPSCCINLYTKW